MTTMVRAIGLTLAMWLGAANAALACPVCFTAIDSPGTRGSSLAILAMLVVTVGMLAAFASFFLYLKRRAKSSPLLVGQTRPDSFI